MFSFFWQRIYCHFFVALALGIAIGNYWPVPIELLTGDALLFFGIVAAVAYACWQWRDHPAPWPYSAGLALIALIGYLSVSLALSLPLAASLNGHTSARPQAMTGRVISIPKYQRGHLRFLMRVESIGKGDGVPTEGVCYVYLRCDPPVEVYMRDRLRLYATLKEVEPAANHGQFNYRRYLMQRGTVLTAYASGPRTVRRLEQGKPVIWSGLSRLRQQLMGTLSAGLPEEYGELAISVVYGDKITDLPPDLEERFRRSGLTHILVASGTQVSLLVIMLALLFWRVVDDFTWRGLLLNLGQAAVTLLIVLAYAAITGFETSIVRALAMGVMILLGKLLHRNADGLTTLAQSGLILLLINPLELFSPGFQLSFGATFGLIYVAGAGFPLVAGLQGWQRVPALMLITTGGAQLFVAPLLAAVFQQLSVWGLASNLLAIPLAYALLIVGGIVSLGAGAIPLVGVLLKFAVLALCWLLDGVARFFASLPGSNLAVPQPSVLWLLGVYLVILLVGEAIKARSLLSGRARLAMALAIPALVMVLCSGVIWWWLVPRPELAALNLPGCEGYLWRSYTGRNILLLRAAGLTTRHNDDAVAAALRYRGINKLHGIIWLDGQPKPGALPDTPALSFVPGDDVPAEWDLAWLGEGGSAWGARLELGTEVLWIVWDRVGDAAIKLAKPPARSPGRSIVLMSGRTWGALSMAARHALAADGTQVFTLAVDGASGAGVQAIAFNNELRVWPGRNGLRLSEFPASSR